MSTVIDACAPIAFLRDEPGAEAVQNTLGLPQTCYVHALNLCEVYYDFWRASNRETAESAGSNPSADLVQCPEPASCGHTLLADLGLCCAVADKAPEIRGAWSLYCRLGPLASAASDSDRDDTGSTLIAMYSDGTATVL